MTEESKYPIKITYGKQWRDDIKWIEYNPTEDDENIMLLRLRSVKETHKNTHFRVLKKDLMDLIGSLAEMYKKLKELKQL